MALFNPARRYAPERSVRDDAALAQHLAERPPEGDLWLVIAPRRAGKTWTLQALQHHLGESARYLDLRSPTDRKTWSSWKKPPAGGHWLLDEISGLTDNSGGSGGRVSKAPKPSEEQRIAQAEAFLDRCAKLCGAGATVVLALTPRELELLQRADGGNGRVSFKSLVPIPPLTPAQAAKLADRAPEAQRLLSALPPAWRRSPFLLELIFHVDEKERAQGRSLPWDELLRVVLEESERENHRYFEYVFGDALTDADRDALRCVARGEKTEDETLRLLTYAGLVDTSDARPYHLADPVLAAHLAPLRIHHLSDVHVGPKAARGFDAKEKGPIADAMDPGFVRDGYLAHLRELQAKGRAPHLVVVSGDLTEWATPDECAAARAWVEQIRPLLGEHVLLTGDTPRVLVVGGNHDVVWDLARDPDPRARHRRFADAFEGLPHPHLEQPPENRQLATVALPDLGVEFLLLGTSELGGHVEAEFLAFRRERENAKLAADATPEARAKAEKDALNDARLDPGLVHAKDLARVGAHRWTQPIKIAVLHHPVSPNPSTEVHRYAGLLNAGAVKQALLEQGFCLVLCGHIHAGWFAEERWPGHSKGTLRIAAAPSLGSWEKPENNGFNVVEILRDREPGSRDTRHQVRVLRFIRQGERSWSESARIDPFDPAS